MSGSKPEQQTVSRGNSQISSDAAVRGSSVPDYSTAGGARAQEPVTIPQATAYSDQLAVRPHGSASLPFTQRLASFLCCRTSLHAVEESRALEESINNGITPTTLPQQGISAIAQSLRAEAAIQGCKHREPPDPYARASEKTLQSFACHSTCNDAQVGDQDTTTNISALNGTKPCPARYSHVQSGQPDKEAGPRERAPAEAPPEDELGLTLHSSDTNVPGAENGNAKPQSSYALRPSWEPFLTDLQPANASKSAGLPVVCNTGKGAQVLQQTQQHQAKLKLRQQEVAAKLNVAELSSWNALRFLSSADVSRDTSPLVSRSENQNMMHVSTLDQEVPYSKLPLAERKTHLLKVLQEAALPLSEANKGQRRLSAPVSTQPQAQMISQGRALPSPWRASQLPAAALSDVANIQRQPGRKTAEDEEIVEVEGFPEDDEVQRRLTFTRLLPVELDEDIDSSNGDASVHGQQQNGDVDQALNVDEGDEGSDKDEFWDARSHASTASWCSATSTTQDVLVVRPQTAAQPGPALNMSAWSQPAVTTRNAVQCQASNIAVPALFQPNGLHDACKASHNNQTLRKAPDTSTNTVATAAGPMVTVESNMLLGAAQPSLMNGAPLQHNSLQQANRVLQALTAKPPALNIPAVPSRQTRHAFNPDMFPPKLSYEPNGKPGRPYEPNKPIMFIDPSTQWKPFPVTTGLSGYWAKVAEHSSPVPMPIDLMLGASWVARKAHESIQGIKIGEHDNHLMISARVSMLGAALIHKEMYRKDGGVEQGSLRRDVKPGHVEYRAYYTTNNEVVLVVESFTMSGQLDTSSVEVIRLKDGTDYIHCDQACYCWRKRKAATQQFVGHRQPLPSHH